MDKIEKLADSLGQVIFRIETNYNFIGKQISLTTHTINDNNRNAHTAILSDIEKLKELKTNLLKIG